MNDAKQELIEILQRRGEETVADRVRNDAHPAQTRIALRSHGHLGDDDYELAEALWDWAKTTEHTREEFA